MMESRGGCRAAIFDMDGTLIDTEKHHFRCWKEAGMHYGFELSWQDILDLRSLDSGMAKDMLENRYPGLDYRETKKIRKELMNEHIERNGIELKPGALEVLDYLNDKGITTMVATATEYELAKRCLKDTGLYDRLDSLISATDLKRGKPYPDIYLYACVKANARPEDCYAVEDSLNGARSAISAGCRTIMVPDGVMPDKDIIKDLTLLTDSLIDLIPYFDEHL